MIIGLIAFISGTLIAHFMKEKNWWLRAHHTLDIIGFVLIIIALIITIYMVNFRTIHSYLGIVNISLYVICILIGPGLFKNFLEKHPQIRGFHRLLSRGTNALMFISLLIGFATLSP